MNMSASITTEVVIATFSVPGIILSGINLPILKTDVDVAKLPMPNVKKVCNKS